MYAVIFKAVADKQDEHYSDTVAIMRDLAFKQYNCVDFYSVTEGDQEVAISYWHSEEDIKNWHKNTKHRVAQNLGREKWYKSYSVEVVEIIRKYHFANNE
ncbi:antibiotic biosynthesis monooxygenase [Vibrio sp. ZSDE26]|uniref:Antibiotic biosynthesis monooxygenase n=1 Tax=Vibrio amylolyticus TaxID=2847292 RepID=A0A9X1XM69_9VIBR|nr:antibiotic biosynthesis monooxygenase [Vibrio amylolyticus]MCK6264393.1 antibiotic biosynthesis monooxygenase [Vibrio amylolyticus]